MLPSTYRLMNSAGGTPSQCGISGKGCRVLGVSSIFMVRGSPDCKHTGLGDVETGPNLFVIDNRRIQLNYRVIIGYAYAPIGGWSPMRLFHVGVLHMDCVFASWNVLKMVETIDTSAKSLYFLKIGTAETCSAPAALPAPE
jgi:hypothetical protein